MIGLLTATIAFQIGKTRGLRHDATPQCELSNQAARGRLWASTCAGCHDLDIKMPNKASGGPNIHDVYMSLAGTASLRYSYKYHAPLTAARNAGVIWTDENLDAYLTNPKDFLVAKVRASPNDFFMNFFIGGQSEEQVQARRDVIAFLREIKGRQCECVVTEIEGSRCGPIE